MNTPRNEPGAAGKQDNLFAKPGRVLVTGGTGFVGSHLVEKLVQRGWRVRLLLRNSSSLRWLDGQPIEYAYGDIRDKASLAGACVGVRGAFHFGGVTRAFSSSEFMEANAQGTRNLAEAVAERAAPGAFFCLPQQHGRGGAGDSGGARPRAGASRGGSTDTRDSLWTQQAPGGGRAAGGGRCPHSVSLRHSTSTSRLRAAGRGVGRPFPAGIHRGILPIPRGTAPRFSLIHVEDLVDAALKAVEVGARGTYYMSPTATNTPGARWVNWPPS